MTVTTIQSNIINHQGETFHTKTGVPFSYKVDEGSIIVSKAPGYPIALASTINKALAQWPTKGPSSLRRIRGRAYIWALLKDGRINGNGHSEPKEVASDDSPKWYTARLIDTGIAPEFKKHSRFLCRKVEGNGHVEFKAKDGIATFVITKEEARKHFELLSN